MKPVVELYRPEVPGKITGTRIAGVLGQNRFETPFEAWVNIAVRYDRIYHADTAQRLAGRLIQPKIGEFLKDYGMKIRSPSEAIGAEIRDGMSIDLYPQNRIFGGQWDFLGPDYVVEVKTAHRMPDEPPMQTILQAALYAWLYGFDTIVITYTALKDDEYPYKMDGRFVTDAVEAFRPSLKNTMIRTYRIYDILPDFEERYILPAVDFWHRYVETGISPPYDPQRDAGTLERLERNKDIIKNLKSLNEPLNALQGYSRK